MDRFSKACKFIPLRGLPTALETAEHLFHHVFRNVGVPEDIVSDRGPQFISHVWKAFFRLLGVRVSLSSGYHPQMNGQAERKIQELRIPGMLPGRSVQLEPFPPMGRVCTKLPCKKLSPRYIGPFKIQRQINEATYQLQLPPRYRIHPTFHVSLLKPCSSLTPDQHEPDEPPPPEILDQPSVYQVRNIMDSRRQGWSISSTGKGYGLEEQSWVARDDILDPMLLQEFHHTHPDRPAPRGRGRPRRRMRASGAAPGGGCNVRESQ